MLDVGINVIGAFNVQHLESLKDIVERVTGVTIRETIPDTFLKRADQVVNLDLAIEDLLDRLHTGKIYAPDKVATALANFFKSENLTSLRELALREVAESVDRAALQEITRRDERFRATDARVMVCLASNSPRASILLRRGSRLAGKLNTDWYAVYVETPGEAPNLIDAQAQRRLHETIERAMELGAEVVRLKGSDPVSTLINFARAHGVGYIVIGRSNQPWWKRLMGQAHMDRMVREADGFDLHIVSYDERGLP
jgi:two-component system sensor histidine kinase KdpD